MTTRAMMAATAVAALLGSAAFAETYGPFPVTLQGYEGDKTNTVSYNGQIGRHVLEHSMRALIKSSDGSDPEALEAKLRMYFDGSDEDLPILAPASKDGFTIKQSMMGEISKTSLEGKIYDGAMAAWPGDLTGKAVAYDLIARAARAPKGVDAENGMNYEQILSKYLNGAVFYHQAVDNYLDEKLNADTKPNDAPYKEGAHYTGKEHSWDEAFGYWGAPAHAAELEPAQIYDIAKGKTSELADVDGDGMIDLKSEYAFQPAYYAAAFDKGGTQSTSYAADIMGAYLAGRKIITDANGAALTDEQRAALKGHAATISESWEKVLAEAVFKYAGSVYSDIAAMGEAADEDAKAQAYAKYVKHWGELKGFSMALQTGKSNLGATAVTMNDLIGYGPVTMDNSYVTGVDADGNLLRDRRRTWSDYQLHMLKIQQLMADEFSVASRTNDRLADLEGLAAELGAKAGAETD